MRPDLFLLWLNNAIKLSQDAAQMLLLGPLSGRSINNRSFSSELRNVAAVSHCHEVRENLLAQSVCVGSPPGCGVAVPAVALSGRGVEEKLVGGEESREEDIT